MKRLISPKTLKRRTWEALSAYIRVRDRKCTTCPTGQAEHCGHYQRNSERNQLFGGNALWWDERNFGGQCVACNNYRGGEQQKFAIVLENKFGHGILQELNDLYHTPKKWTREEILKVESYYKEKLKQLNLTI